MQKLQLFGSTTSPYVRRLRIFMQEIPHDFILVDIFNNQDREEIQGQNPTLKVPMLKDGTQVVLDSGAIHRYLVEREGTTALTWDQQNVLTSIDAANDSLVQMFILSRSEIDTSADKLFFRIQRERLSVVFGHLEQLAVDGLFSRWDYLSISLYCLLDWLLFRQLFDVSTFPKLVQLHKEWEQLAICHQTDPRI